MSIQKFRLDLNWNRTRDYVKETYNWRQLEKYGMRNS